MKIRIERIVWLCITGILFGSLISVMVNKNSTAVLNQRENSLTRNLSNQGYNFKAQSNLLGYYEFLSTAIEYLKRYYVNAKDLDLNNLFFNAVDGLYKGVGDPYTALLSPSFYKEISQDIEGKIGGIGVFLENQNGKVVILSIIKGSPAFNKGLKIKDTLVTINGKPVDAKNLDKTAGLIQGALGSKITLEIYRDSTKQHFYITLVRSKIKVSSVYTTMLPGKVGYIRINHFAETTPLEVKKSLATLMRLGLSSLIIDVRYNPGGSFPAVINIANMFLSKGLLVYTKGPNKEDNGYYYAKASNLVLPLKTKIVVLVNESSASAAEILAGTLKDNHRALLVGKKTFGKGSVQSVFPLKINNQELGFKITVANYYTPGGYIISGKGIKPDVDIDLPIISPVDDAKIHQIIDKQIVFNFLKSQNFMPLNKDSYLQIKNILKANNLGLPDNILNKIIFEQENISKGKLDFVDLNFDTQLIKARNLLVNTSS